MKIDNVELLMDKEGRYNLASLAKAAKAQGITKDVRPAEFLALDRVTDTIEILKGESDLILPVAKVRGRHGGTYVVEELVVMYASWVSIEFNLKVTRVFLRRNNIVQFPTPEAATKEISGDYLIALGQQINVHKKETIKAKARILELEVREKEIMEKNKPIIDGMNNICDSDTTYTQRVASKILQVKPSELAYELKVRRWAFKEKDLDGKSVGPYIGYQSAIDTGYMKHIMHDVGRNEVKMVQQARVTSKGLAKLATLKRISKASNNPPGNTEEDYF